MAELMHRRQQAEQGLDAARNASDEEQQLDALARGDHLAAKMGRAKLCGLLIDRRGRCDAPTNARSRRARRSCG